MGVPRGFRAENGAEYTSSTFVDYCNGLGIRHKLMAPYTSQQNDPVESRLSRPIKAGHAARLEMIKLFPDIHLETLKGVRDPDDSSLWMDSVLWASERLRMKYSSGAAARRCRSCCSVSRRTIASHGGVNWAPRRAHVFPEFWIQP